jgi:hypothetical protein
MQAQVQLPEFHGPNLNVGCIYTNFGPLHTRAKSRDHEIVRAQKKVSKGRPNTPPKSCSVVMDPQV